MTVVCSCAACGRVHHDLASVLEDVCDGPALASCDVCAAVTQVKVARIGVDVHSTLCVDSEGGLCCECGKELRDQEAA